ncbi:hypothetical protein [Actinoplanes solisilvae]|uniref:hypothetical protein n=1 Tax=Actinoplanes solisilvae TaxID=2486853 RepID=UPI000FDBE495|nr:hypothetical protein [Actinoplanes solisilvae]
MRRIGAAVLAGLVLAFVPVGSPAWAHEGKLKLEVAGDGATGVTVQALHADGHRLETVVRLVVSATGAGGQTVGPVQLDPAGEGQGFYSSGAVLTPGDWRVTVRAPKPYTGEATVAVRAKAPQAAPSASPVPASSSEGGSWWPYAVGGLAVAVVALVLVPLVGRRRRS